RGGEALEVSQRLRATLVRDLGLEPSVELQRRQRSILMAHPETTALAAGGAGRQGGRLGVGHEDGALQALQFHGGLKSQVAYQGCAQPLVDLQCLAAASRAVQGEHELPVQALVGAVAVDQDGQFGEQFAVASELEVGLDALVQRAQPVLLQAADLHLQLRAGLDVGQGGAGPQAQGLAQLAGGGGEVAGVHGPVAGAGQALEGAHVAAAAAGGEQVAAGHGHQDVLGAAPGRLGGVRVRGAGLQGGGDQFAQLQDVGLQGGACAARRGGAPQLVDQ
ncbi:hypothetical protein HF200_16695, partial [Streptomyces galbus]|nr:hypothetical protein [Streptomyces galbus]